MKKFYNNTKMSGAFSSALRVLALLCVLLGFSSSAWAADYYFFQTNADDWCNNTGTWMSREKNDNVYTIPFKITKKNTNYYFWISTKNDDKKSIQSNSDIGFEKEKFTSSGVTFQKKEYGCTPSNGSHIAALGFYVYGDTDNTDITIIVDISNAKEIKVTIPEICRPKSNILSAVYNSNTKKIDLKGSLTKTCDIETEYGFEYKKGSGSWTEIKVDESAQTIAEYTVQFDPQDNWGEKYSFRTYTKSDGTKISDSKEKTVTIPERPTEVLLTKDAVYNEDTKKANLYGYLRQNPEQDGDKCINVVDYGFVLVQGMSNKPTIDDIILPVGSNDYSLSRGETFSGEIDVLESGESTDKLIKGNVYSYRAYMIVGGDVFYSSETRYLSTGACIPQPGGNGTVYITVDGSRNPAKDDDCGLVYSDLQVALEKLKANPIYTDTETGNLLQAVVINVSQFDNTAGEAGRGNYVGGKYLENGEVKSGKTYAVCGGDNGSTRDLRVLAIEKFNYNEDAETYDPEHTLTIQANNGDKPRIEHILIRNSRNIILKGLNILSNNDGTTKDTALEMDAGFAGGDWGTVTIENGIKDANIIVKDCSIGSNGFTGVHVNSYSGLTFENNTFNLSVEDYGENARDYGSSAKFFECDNIKFIRNNFWGGHSTLLWIQQTTNALFYNNVFWNTNGYNNGSCQAVRIYNQSYVNKTSTNNIAILYNTFYLANNENSGHYSFIYFGGVKENYNVTGNVYFKYNNCYSYDEDMKEQRTDPLNLYTNDDKSTLCPNNFWSVWDNNHNVNGPSVYNHQYKYTYNDNTITKTETVAGFGNCSSDFVNIKNLVCETTASGPAELVIRDLGGEGLRVGNPISTQDIHSMSSILLTDEELLSDRYRSGVRQGEKWTMGALEATATNYVETIYWIGGKNGNWDDRGNWAYILDEGSAATTRAANQRTLTCVDILSPNLKIVIPQKGSAKYPTATTSTYYYPEIPASFDATNREKSGIPEGEQVSAGVGVPNASIEKYATSIELEYGAALKGVHRLWDQSANKFRYDEGITSMTLNRDQWTLVGPVVFPWKDDTKTETRDVISGDYFLDYIPNVYMHEAVIGGTNEQPSLTWNKSFASLSVPVPANSAFAVSIPNSYGNLWGIGFPADVYYTQIAPDESMINDATVPKSFKPFEGRFVNENALITYSGLTPGQPVLLNNSYPCNIDVKKLEDNYANGKVYLYDYLAKSIKVAGDATWATAEGSYKGYNGVNNGVNTQYIKPQNGFVFIPEKESVTVTEDMLVGGDTKSRSAEIENNKVAINLHAGSSNSLVHSSISIEHDPELGTNVESAINAPKVFAYREAPELYMMAHDKTLCRLAVPKSETVIPLGIQVKTPMYVTFKVARNSGYSKVTLVDTENDYEHDLLESPYTADILPKGTCEGRYFLNVVSEASDYGEDDVPTSVEDASDEDLAINIYNDTDNSDAITVVTSNVELEKIYVSDSMGRVIPFEAKGNYAKIKIPNAMGVYIIQVIGDKASRTEKVILK